MKKAVFAPTAEADLEEIYDYIAADNPLAAVRFVARLEDLATQLARTPGMGRARPALLPNLRSFPLGNYLLFYRLTESGVEIVRVLHGARDVPTIFSALGDDHTEDR
jgi:toxin ParE1/3/4